MVQLLGVFSFLVVLLRAATMCFQSVAVGGIVFLLVVARRPDLRPASLVDPCWKLIRWTAAALAASHLLFVIANSLILTSSENIALTEVLGANFVIAGAVGIAAALVIVFWPTSLRSSGIVWALLPAALMVSASVLTSHAASRMEQRGLLVTLTAVHYIATATWIGGLPYLLIAMRRVEPGPQKAEIGRNFSLLAQISVASLFGAGLWMSFSYLGSWAALYGTSYGVMLLAKITLFACLLMLGFANHYVVKSMTGGDTTGSLSLMRFGEVEIGLGLTVILVAASLTSQPPGIDLPDDRVTLQQITERFAPRMPRLISPDKSELSESSKEIYKHAAESGHALPAAFVPGQSAVHPDTPGDIAWSEYNHNWAGLIVFFVGVFALLSRSRYFAWAKMWPLLFLALAIFLFLRADPENWPLGPNGFWASFMEADVLQHRLAVLMIIAFAFFQWAVETNRLKSHAAALVFPAVCALGGVVLLTHTHAVSNVKEEMLAELSHTSLAIFGLLAGWSRWLELRLPAENKARPYLAWVWPVCFMMVGLILLDYHESDIRL